MAKRPLKKKVDPLAVALKQLAIADRETARAVRDLCEALLVPVEKPVFKECKFKLDKKTYRARLWSDQRKKILSIVKSKGNVLKEVSELLGELSGAVAGCANSLLGEFSAAEHPAVNQPIKLGCCKYDGGQTANLTQSQCMQYTGSTWDNGDPGCQNIEPS